MRRAPIARQMAPMMAATLGPYLSKIVPTGNEETLQVVDAMAKNKFNLEGRQSLAPRSWA